jgi:hypothetical protein
LTFPDNAQHQFCDSECLRSWLDAQQQLFEAGMKQEIEQLVRDRIGAER